ncbi:hypothetical protein PPL_01651 [Heterostelium album PN500]|uniref:Uncharacterized protein n=1 Tax=Heterostelium pallidum (strain ATCC 26659 / Pp 5 / PN500) TaxID=670386 RepID=D3B037_HETP5|nr:hypothetical protein PPL_01651 [Heterostelium album PN500]EFA84661.1 hypothetical protein PPL_01651 [Heterostelium album PN500]|eukprot:XP_020436774.1 hypothetical protein PPL_01651 [Heterostelium album PN500]
MKDIWKAAKKGDVKTIKKYVPSTIKVDQLDKEGRSALHWAIEGDQPEIAIYLMDNGANIELKDPKYLEAVCIFKCRKIIQLPIVVSLKKAVTVEKQEEIAIMLLKKGANLSSESKDHKSIDRLLETVPKRFQVTWKEVYQRKYNKTTIRPTAQSSPNLSSTINTQMSSISLSSSTPNANLSGSADSIPQATSQHSPQQQPPQTISSAKPASFSPPLKPLAVGVISTVAQAPVVSASGKTESNDAGQDHSGATVVHQEYHGLNGDVQGDTESRRRYRARASGERSETTERIDRFLQVQQQSTVFYAAERRHCSAAVGIDSKVDSIARYLLDDRARSSDGDPRTNDCTGYQ